MQKTTISNSNPLRSFLVILSFIIFNENTQAQLTNFGNLHIYAAGNIKVNGSFVNTGAATDLNNGGSLQLTGDFTNNGNDLDAAGTGTVTFGGTATQNINGTQPTTFYNLIQANTNNVILASNETVNNSLTLTAGSLSLNDHTLTLNGAVTNASGNLSSTDLSGLILNGSAAKNLYFNPANHTIKNVTVNASATNVNLDDSLDIAGNTSGVIIVNGKLNTSDYLTLKSDANGTASVAASGGTINGNVTVERFIGTGTMHGKSWQLLATPTRGQTIKDAWQEGATAVAGMPGGDPHPGFGTQLTSNVANAATQPDPGFDAYTAPGPSIKVYNSVTNAYDGPLTTAIPIYNAKGYFVLVRGDRSKTTYNAIANPTVLRTKGQLFTAANPPPSSVVAGGHFESVGNPYASAIDLRKLSFDPGVNKAVIVWDPTIAASAYGLGAFQTLFLNGDIDHDGVDDYVNLVTSTAYGTAGTVHNTIQSGQAFLIQGLPLPSPGGAINFAENAKATGSPTLLFRPQAPGDDKQAQLQLRTNLYGVNARDTFLTDGTLIQYSDAYSDSIDGLDARKMTNSGENLSVKSGGVLLVIERRHTIIPQDTVFLNLTGTRVQPYQLEFIAGNLSGGPEGFLEDNYLHTRTPLNMNGRTVVNFSIENIAGSYAHDRFRIVFAPSALLPVTFTSLQAYLQGKNIEVKWKVDNEANIKQYDVEKSIDGSQFSLLESKVPSGNNGHSAIYVTADANPVEGYNYYRIKSIDNNGNVSYSNIVKAQVGTSKGNINIYPNPIVDGIIHLQLNNQAQGKYAVRLLNRIGQVILAKEIIHAGGNSTQQIKCNVNLAHGLYELEVTRPDGSHMNINVIY